MRERIGSVPKAGATGGAMGGATLSSSSSAHEISTFDDSRLIPGAGFLCWIFRFIDYAWVPAPNKNMGHCGSKFGHLQKLI
jgi:hypothetical protein